MNFWGHKLKTKSRYELKCSAGQAFNIVFGSIGLILRIDGRELQIGRGSNGCLTNLRYFHSDIDDQLILKVGDFSEFSRCDIILGGEHRSDQFFNGSLNSFPHAQSERENTALYNLTPLTRQKGPITIGSNVTVSMGAKILPGVSIADGTVVAAGAVVTRHINEIACFSGGIPARVIGKRFSSESELKTYQKISWNKINIHDYFWLAEKLSTTDAKEVDKILENFEFSYDSNNYVVFKASKGDNKIPVPRDLIGIVYRDEFIKLKETPKEFIEYLGQGADAKLTTVTWIPDPFDYFLGEP